MNRLVLFIPPLNSLLISVFNIVFLRPNMADSFLGLPNMENLVCIFGEGFFMGNDNELESKTGGKLFDHLTALFLEILG